MIEKKIEMILHRDHAGELRLWACRGEGKGCKRNTLRRTKKPCDDCWGPLDESLTVGEVYDRLKTGDA
jgi:hypothetical protein